jgi:hypothetical protein
MSKNTVTKSQIDQILDTADKQEHVFWDKELVVSYLLPNGFSIVGRGACVDPANFDIEIGRSVARDDVENQLWKLEGYLLQQTLFQHGEI